MADEFTEPVIIEFYLGVTRCPPGEAANSHELRTRGMAGWRDITCWPSTKQHSLYDGGMSSPWNEPPTIVQAHGVRLWSQEMYVYLQERNRTLGIMLDELEYMAPLPRRKKDEMRPEPMPGDFGTRCVWCNHEWTPEENDPDRSCPKCGCALTRQSRYVYKEIRHPHTSGQSAEHKARRKTALKKALAARALNREARKLEIQQAIAREEQEFFDSRAVVEVQSSRAEPPDQTDESQAK